METNPDAFLRLRHLTTKICKWGRDRNEQHEAGKCSALALDQVYTAYGEELERVGRYSSILADYYHLMTIIHRQYAATLERHGSVGPEF